MKLAEHQVDFLPYGGFFAKLLHTDRLMLCDRLPGSQTCAYVKRNRLRDVAGWRWLTVPARKHKRPVRQVTVRDVDRWWTAVAVPSFISLYNRTPYPERLDALTAPLEGAATLFDVNYVLLRRVIEILDPTLLDRLVLETETDPVPGVRDEESVNRCLAFGSDTYVSGSGALVYMDADLFAEAGVRLTIVRWEPRPYRQMFSGWEPNMSVVDVLMCVGDPLAYIAACSRLEEAG